MFKLLGVLVFIFGLLVVFGNIVGRRMEDAEEKHHNDAVIKDGLKVMKSRIMSIQSFLKARGERS